MIIDKYLGISYKLASSENFDEYMKALGIGAITRKMGNMVTPIVTLTKEGDVYTLTTSSTFKSTAISFKPDEEFEEETADGRRVQSIVHFDGHVMTHTQKGEKTTVIIREFSIDHMKAIMTVGNVKCTRLYQKAK